MAVQWTPDLATGAKQIDEQHKELFRRVNTLLDAWTQGKARTEVDTVIQFLGDYVVEHFGTEERFMDQFNYGNAASQHKAQHAVFINLFGKLKERYMKEGPTPAFVQDTKETVVDWLTNHIKYSDKALGLFLKMKMR
jgi:hemerythrin